MQHKASPYGIDSTRVAAQGRHFSDLEYQFAPPWLERFETSIGTGKSGAR
jgi:hypothetical protein